MKLNKIQKNPCQVKCIICIKKECHSLLVLLTLSHKIGKNSVLQDFRKKSIIITCANTAGQAIPAMIIFKGKYLNYK